ncbi:MAG TPA: DUF4136 domain-containing protein [Marinagarivorans sp.]
MKLYQSVKRCAQAVLCLGVLAVVGCATGPKIHSVYETGVDFNSYKTFAFLDSLEPSGEQEYRSLTNKYLKEAIRKQLTARGLSEQKGGDLLIGFNVSTKEKIESTTAPAISAGYYGYRGRYGYSYGMGYGTETRVSQYTEGTLNIDVVDAEQKQLIWEGVAVGKLKKPKQNELRSDIHTVVQQIFVKYPVPAPSVETP